MVTTVKDELPLSGSDVVSLKLNVFSLSKVTRTSFVSLGCETVASTSSLMWLKLYFVEIFPDVPTKPIYVKRHVNNLVVLVPADERDDFDLGELQRGPQQCCNETISN